METIRPAGVHAVLPIAAGVAAAGVTQLAVDRLSLRRFTKLLTVGTVGVGTCLISASPQMPTLPFSQRQLEEIVLPPLALEGVKGAFVPRPWEPVEHPKEGAMAELAQQIQDIYRKSDIEHFEGRVFWEAWDMRARGPDWKQLVPLCAPDEAPLAGIRINDQVYLAHLDKIDRVFQKGKINWKEVARQRTEARYQLIVGKYSMPISAADLDTLRLNRRVLPGETVRLDVTDYPNHTYFFGFKIKE